MLQLDSRNMLGSIDLLAQQCQEAWASNRAAKIPQSYKKINKIALFGMGGSALGLDVIRHLFSQQLTVPCQIINDYSLPAWVDQNTLAILSSYSGSTEETLAVAQKILSVTKKVLVITSGKNLKIFKEKNSLPGYLIEPHYNPCQQPRMAVGYSIVGLLGLLRQSGLLKINDSQIQEMVTYLEKNKLALKKSARQYAQRLQNKALVYVASEFLLGNAHVLSNQTNENGKNFSCFFALPELNHHLMEGLGHPASLTKNITFIFLKSDLYHPRNQRRYSLTQQVIAKNKLTSLTWQPPAKNKLLQSFATLAWGSYLSFYLATLNNKLDPSPIPWVDYFKKQLA